MSFPSLLRFRFPHSLLHVREDAYEPRQTKTIKSISMRSVVCLLLVSAGLVRAQQYPWGLPSFTPCMYPLDLIFVASWWNWC